MLQPALYLLNDLVIIAAGLQQLMEFPGMGSTLSHMHLPLLEVVDCFTDRICEVYILWHPDHHCWQMLLASLPLHFSALRGNACEVPHILLLHVEHEVTSLRGS